MHDAVSGMLKDEEARVLGSLMEKQMTTPDYYPLTLKALTAACNQKSSRVPVMSLSESQVAGVVNGLRSEGLVTARMDGRVDRFEQQLSRKLGLSSKERAVLCVLMLRDALTLNEIRINTGRMVEFSDNHEVEEVLQALIERDEPLLVRIPRAAGQREDRYAQLLCGEVDMDSPQAVQPSSLVVREGASDRLEALEKQVADLQEELRQLRELIESR